MLGYLGGFAALFLLQRSFLFPTRKPDERRRPPRAFPQAEEHLLTTADGEKVIVWHVPAKPGHPVVLYFHGNGDFLAGFFDRFHDLIADGDGRGCPVVSRLCRFERTAQRAGSVAGCRRRLCLRAARYRPERIVVWGFSLGTGVAVALAADSRGQADPGSAVHVDRRHRGFRVSDLPRPLVIRDPFHSDRLIARVGVPLLVMHGARDPTIPIAFGERLFALANEPKKFVRFDAGGHNDLDNFDAMDEARQFIGATEG